MRRHAEAVLPATYASEALPATMRALVGASLRLLVVADEAATRAAGTTERLRAAAVLPLPRRPYDEL